MLDTTTRIVGYYQVSKKLPNFGTQHLEKLDIRKLQNSPPRL